MRLLLSILIAAVAAGCYDTFDEPAATVPDPENANIAIGDLTAMYRGQTVSISENLTIAGRVTSSDRAGNFRYSFTVEQDGSAVEIMVRLTDLHNIWPVGCRVAVHLQGLAMGESYGVKCIGRQPAAYGYMSVDYIGSRVEADRCIFRTHDAEPFGIEAFTAGSLSREMCGRLVRVVSLTRTGDAEERAVWSGYNIFEDAEEQTRIAVYVRSYANFATHEVPGSEIAVTGILQYGRPDGAGEDMFIIKPRDEDDILPY